MPRASLIPAAGNRACALRRRAGPGARRGGCRVPTRPQGGTLVPRPARSSGTPAGRRPPPPAGNVSPGDAAPGGERGATAAATVRASAACEDVRGHRRRRRWAGSGGRAPPGSRTQAPDVGRRRRRGSRSGRGAPQSGAAPPGGAAVRGSMLGSGASRPR